MESVVPFRHTGTSSLWGAAGFGATRVEPKPAVFSWHTISRTDYQPNTLPAGRVNSFFRTIVRHLYALVVHLSLPID